jgi:uncharacterized protein YkwD
LLKSCAARADDIGVAVDDRDWLHEPRPPVRRGRTDAVVLIAALVVLFVGWKLELGRYIPLSSAVPAGVRPAGQQPLYAPDDQWTAWLAPESACPGGEQVNLAPQDELATMYCLINYARQRQGLVPLSTTIDLNGAAATKATDIARCGHFEHGACGKAPSQDASDAGYTGTWGENLYVGEGPLAAPRVAMDGWLNSPHHRENLFRSDWRTAGLAEMPGVSVDQFRSAVVWVNEFGDH